MRHEPGTALFGKAVWVEVPSYSPLETVTQLRPPAAMGQAAGGAGCLSASEGMGSSCARSWRDKSLVYTASVGTHLAVRCLDVSALLHEELGSGLMVADYRNL